jgi:hypothetical protein
MGGGGCFFLVRIMLSSLPLKTLHWRLWKQCLGTHWPWTGNNVGQCLCYLLATVHWASI